MVRGKVKERVRKGTEKYVTRRRKAKMFSSRVHARLHAMLQSCPKDVFQSMFTAQRCFQLTLLQACVHVRQKIVQSGPASKMFSMRCFMQAYVSYEKMRGCSSCPSDFPHYICTTKLPVLRPQLPEPLPALRWHYKVTSSEANCRRNEGGSCQSVQLSSE